MIAIAAESVHRIRGYPIIRTIRPRERNLENIVQIQIGLSQHEAPIAQIGFKPVNWSAVFGRHSTTAC